VGTDLTAGYNTYAINWVPGKSITWYLNGKETEQITSAQAKIPNEPMELIFSEAAAGPSTRGWHTVTDQSTPGQMAMMVNDVQLYQTAGDTLYLNGKLASASSHTHDEARATALKRQHEAATARRFVLALTCGLAAVAPRERRH
jgi:beta-glucanase (GH16 family)